MWQRTDRQWAAINELCAAFDLNPADVCHLDVWAGGPLTATVAKRDADGRQVRPAGGSPTARETTTVIR